MSHDLDKPRKKSRISARTRKINTILLVLVLVLITSMAAAMVISITNKASREFARLYSTETVEKFHAYINLDLVLVQMISHSKAVTDWFTDEDNPVIRTTAYYEMMNYAALLQTRILYFGIHDSLNEYYLDKDVELEDFAPIGWLDPEVLYNNWYYDCINSDNDYALNIDIDKVSGTARMWINHKVMNGEEISGVFCSGLPFDEVSNNLFIGYDAKNIKGYVIDRHGFIKLDSSQSDFYFEEAGTRIPEAASEPALASAIESYLENIGYYTRPHAQPKVIKLRKGSYNYVSLAPITGSDWLVVTFFSSKSLFSVTNLVPLIIIMLSAFLLYFLVVNGMIHRFLLTPISHLTKSLSEAKSGAVAIFGHDRDDEIGDLARTIREMRDQLGAYNKNLLSTTDKLGRQEQLLHTVNQMSGVLLAADDENFEASLMEGMRLIAGCLDVDRIHVWQNEMREGNFCYSLRFKWMNDVGRQTNPVPDDASFAYDHTPSWKAKLIKGECINGPLSAMPPIEQGRLREFGMKSVFVIPVFPSDYFWGFVSFDDCRQERTLTEDELEILRSGSLIMVSSVNRNAQEVKIQRMMKGLEQRDTLLQTVNTIANLLLQSPIDEYASVLWTCMGMMAKAVNADRVYIWKNHAVNDQLFCTQIFEWSEGAQPQQGNVLTVDVSYSDIAPGWEQTLSQGNCINDIVSNLSGEVQKQLSGQGILSIFVVPVIERNEFWGFVGYDDCHSERVFTKNEESILRSASILIANSLLRNEMTLGMRDTADQLEAALVKAQAASRAKSSFLSNMSHEMRTPMNAIIGMTMIGKSAHDMEKKDYAFEKIGDASNHLLGVINDVLDMSKIEANKFELSFIEFDFERILQKVINIVNFRVDEKRQNLSVYLDPVIPQTLIGDDQRLSQVLTNLITNAVKFTPEQGAICLNVFFIKEEDGLCTLQVEVTDTGIGISVEQQARLFASFEQAESSTSRKFGGTGLGLAISKRIIELMGGRIWVQSELGSGSTFAFTVQLRRGKEKTANPLLPGVDWSHVRLLAVDDDPTVQEYFIRLTRQFGLKCDAVAGGAEALQCIKNNGPFDIYFIDWKMPGMNGIELSRQIKAQDKGNSVIIMITAYEWNEIEGEARAIGVDDFLPKPLFPSSVIGCINKFIASADSSATDKAAPEQQLSFPGRRLLLAEDVEINREIVKAMLEPLQLEIDCAINGKEAVSMFSSGQGNYDLIFMDLQMPEMDGFAATQQIRGIDSPKAREIPIIAMTANVFREDIEKCLEVGMNDHLGKPLDFEEVVEKLKIYLQQGNRS